MPKDAYELLRKDSVAFEYLFVQVGERVTGNRKTLTYEIWTDDIRFERPKIPCQCPFNSINFVNVFFPERFLFMF